MISTTCYDSPLGRMLATAEEHALTGLYFIDQKYYPSATDVWHEDDSAQPFVALRLQLDEYFAGTRRVFDLPLNPGGSGGTSFQRKIWSSIAAVPFGETVSYATLATRSGRPSAARASGAATGRNPISLIVPCHRIVGSGGALTGYAGGLARKRALLAFERAVAAGEFREIARIVAGVDAVPSQTSARPERQSDLGL